MLKFLRLKHLIIQVLILFLRRLR